MKERSFETISQKEAMLNELKGNLFEYLVALEFSKLKGIQGSFLTSFQGYAKEQFIKYENWIRDNAQYLLFKLPPLAAKTAQELNQQITEEVVAIQVIGKILSESSDNRGKFEGDLLVSLKDGRNIPVSLKLCKANAFVNTKSGGVKSFIEKYFSEFSESKNLQKELNDSVDSSFHLMGHKLYEMAGLDFKGSFDDQWKNEGFSELPGQLDDNQRKIIHNSYQSAIKSLYEMISKLSKINDLEFAKSIQGLMGFSGNALQLICYYSAKGPKEGESSYQFKTIKTTKGNEVQEISNELSIGKLKEGLSSFEINLKDRILQIRIKPMNKFTACAHKVNCSVKIS